MGQIAENLLRIRSEVENLTRKLDRPAESVQIVAVSKTFDEGAIREARSAGQTQFGENYAVEFQRKVTSVNDPSIRWHFIGHLQSNKARLVVGSAHLIHSLDRVSLAKEIQKRAESLDIVVEALVEVLTTTESTKTGVDPDAVPDFVRSMDAFDRINIRGLMTMGPFSGDPENARPCFRRLRQLQQELRDGAPHRFTFDELSMGMSSDFHVAIEEGATLIRIGTSIFGTRSTTRA